MKSTILYLFVFSFPCLAAIRPIQIKPEVIYGTDDRVDIFMSSDSLMKRLSQSTAAKIMNNHLIKKGEVLTLEAPSLKEWGGVCSTERFADQMAAASCSGFLVAEDILITAGHCIYSELECGNHSWVFDYANIAGEQEEFNFKKDQVYQCTKIISRQKNAETLDDFAVIKLDRPVAGRVPLKIRSGGKISDDAVLTVLGYPSGLPLKITSGAQIRQNSDPYFFTINSDTYVRNSGSAVVDSRTGIVEGILVRGDTDFFQENGQSCAVSVYREMDGGKGEDVTRITNLKF